MAFAIRIDRAEAGLAVGVADPREFNPQMHNLGVSAKSWALSKSGKASSGDGWQPFTDRLRLRPGDEIGIYVDLRSRHQASQSSDSADAGCIVFYLNGRRLGSRDVAPFTGLHGQGLCLVPALCMGTTAGGQTATAELCAFQPADHPHANGGRKRS